MADNHPQQPQNQKEEGHEAREDCRDALATDKNNKAPASFSSSQISALCSNPVPALHRIPSQTRGSHACTALSNLLSQFSMSSAFKSSILRNVSAFTGRMEHPRQALQNPARSGPGCSGSCPVLQSGNALLVLGPPGTCPTCTLGSAARSGCIHQQLQLL